MLQLGSEGAREKITQFKSSAAVIPPATARR
jgi:hypothetical protein